MGIKNIFWKVNVETEKSEKNLRNVSKGFVGVSDKSKKAEKGTLQYEEAARRTASTNEKLGRTFIKSGKSVRTFTNQLRSYRQESERTTKTGNSLNSVFRKVGITFGVIQAIRLGSDMVNLSAAGEGIIRAFARLPESTKLMLSLKESTKGTVKELDLMVSAVTAKQFGVALGELPILLQFAKKIADDTGGSVDILTDKIVRGIGRKSVLILDDLGLSANQIKDALNGVSLEAASVGQVTQAVALIAKKALDEVGETTLTSANKIQMMTVAFENIKQSLGGLIISIIGDYEPTLRTAAKATFDFFNNIDVEKVKLLIKGLVRMVGLLILLKTAQAAYSVRLSISAVITSGYTLVVHALTIAKALYTGQTKRAAAATRLFFRVLLSNPFVAFAAILVVLLPLIINYINKIRNAGKETKNLTTEQKLLQTVSEKTIKLSQKELVELRKRITLLKATVNNSQERKKQIDILNNTYGTTLKNLKDEEAFIREVEAAYKGVVEQIKEKARASAIESLLTENQRKQIVLEALLGVEIEKITLTREEEFNKRTIQSAKLSKMTLSEIRLLDQQKNTAQAVSNTLTTNNKNRLAELKKEEKALLGLIPKARPKVAIKGDKSGTIAAIQIRIKELKKQRIEEIKLLVNGKQNIEEFRKNAILLDRETKRLNDAIKFISPVEPYKSADKSIKEIKKELDSIQQAITDTEEKGLSTDKLQERLEKTKELLKDANEIARVLELKNNLLLETERTRHQQELIEQTDKFNGKELKTEEDKNRKIIELEILLLKKRLEIRKEMGDLSEAEALKINNRIEELTLENQKNTQKKRMSSLKDFLDAFGELELSERAELIGELISAITNLAKTLTQIQIDNIDKLTNLQSQRVEDAKKIAEDGNVALLEEEKKRLEELNRERERFVRRQQIINGIELVSNSLVAISKAAAQGGAAAPFTIAATLAALVAGLAQARSVASQAAFKDGIVDYRGSGTTRSDSNVVRISNRESIIKADSTANSKGLLTAINDGNMTDGLFAALQNNQRSLSVITDTRKSTQDGGRTPSNKELKEIVKLLKGQKSSETNITEKGIVKIIERNGQRTRRVMSKI